MARHSPLGPNQQIRVSPPGSASIDSFAQLVAEACVYRTKGLRSTLTNLSDHNDGNHSNQDEQQGVLDEAGAFVIRREPVHELDHEVEHLSSPLSELSLKVIGHLVFAFHGSGDPKKTHKQWVFMACGWVEGYRDEDFLILRIWPAFGPA